MVFIQACLYLIILLLLGFTPSCCCSHWCCCFSSVLQRETEANENLLHAKFWQWWPFLLPHPCTSEVVQPPFLPKQAPPIKWLCLALVIEVMVRATVQFRVFQSEVWFVCSWGGSAAPETQPRERNNYCKIYGWQLQQRKCLRHKKSLKFPV